jgi:hypothetical protein
MEERAFGDAGREANVIDSSGRIALGADHDERGVQEPGFRIATCSRF